MTYRGVTLPFPDLTVSSLFPWLGRDTSPQAHMCCPCTVSGLSTRAISHNHYLRDCSLTTSLSLFDQVYCPPLSLDHLFNVQSKRPNCFVSSKIHNKAANTQRKFCFWSKTEEQIHFLNTWKSFLLQLQSRCFCHVYEKIVSQMFLLEIDWPISQL